MEILRYAAFTTDPAGGNPAGVILDASGLDDTAMLTIAADLGFSETAFLFPLTEDTFDVRYFSPLVEVPFCGHATIASAVAYAHRNGIGGLRLNTRAGPVDVKTEHVNGTRIVATLTSVPPKVRKLAAVDSTELLAALRWRSDELDGTLPVLAAYAGAWHPIVAARTRDRLADLDYDFAALSALMKRKDWATVSLIWRESARLFYARNPFPPGGVFEDPATGAAAAALGGYLRELSVLPLPATIVVRQGDDMGRPGELIVTIPAEGGSGIFVTGSAVPIPDAK